MKKKKKIVAAAAARERLLGPLGLALLEDEQVSEVPAAMQALAAVTLASATLAHAASAPPMPHVLFVDHTQLSDIDPRLELRMQQPVKGPRVLWPTESWESWAVFAYNSVVAGDKTASPPRPHRMYYDCIGEDVHRLALISHMCVSRAVLTITARSEHL